jgi:antirestriction protein ArdC
MSTSERQSLYGEVTAKIIAELEEGRLPWVQPWDASRCPCTMPHNGVSGRVQRVETLAQAGQETGCCKFHMLFQWGSQYEGFGLSREIP